jgi:hypothetical protein
MLHMSIDGGMTWFVSAIGRHASKSEAEMKVGCKMCMYMGEAPYLPWKPANTCMQAALSCTCINLEYLVR